MTLAFAFPRGIRAQLALFAVVATLPLAAFIASGYLERVANHTVLVGDFARDLAAIAAGTVAQIVEDDRVMLAALAARPAQRIERPERCDSLIVDALVLQPGRANITVQTASGEVVCSAVPLTPGADVSIVHMEHVQRLLRTGEFVVGERHGDSRPALEGVGRSRQAARTRSDPCSAHAQCHAIRARPGRGRGPFLLVRPPHLRSHTRPGRGRTQGTCRANS